jgi:D-alanyl-D-alanine carboxypeptidase
VHRKATGYLDVRLASIHEPAKHSDRRVTAMRYLVCLALATSCTLAAAATTGDRWTRATDRIAREVSQTEHSPALAICVIQHGRVLVNRAYGTADLENEVPATTRTEFSIASITKQLTAAAILQLAARGKIRLDDDISLFVSGFPGDRGITIRRLLNHTAGIHNINSLPSYWAQSGQAITPDALAAFFRDLPLDFEPGTDYRYSNSGYILLGLVIEKVSGQPYADYVRKNLLDPLHLDEMVYGGTSRLIPHRARGYRYDGSAFVNAEHYHDSQAFAMGGFLSTASDLARWTSALHDGEVLPAAAYKEMITPAVLPSGEVLTYGYGVELGAFDHRHLLSHAGGGVGFMSQAIFVQEEDLTIVALSNTITGGSALEVADRLMRTLLGTPNPSDVSLSHDVAGRYVGSYLMDGQTVRILEQGENLAAAYGEADVRRLHYMGNGVFAQEGRLSRLHFVETKGVVTGFVLARYGSLLAKAVRTGN